jgi:hypothetical protein
MRFSAFIILASVLLALTSCIVEPDGDRRGDARGHEDHHEDHDDNRRM